VKVPKNGWNIELARGNEKPEPQGWYSAEYNVREPATCAVCTTVAAGPATYVWLMWTEPAGRAMQAGQPKVKVVEESAARLKVELKWPDGKVDEATVPWVKDEAAGWGRM
jgi:hypothetical protein